MSTNTAKIICELLHNSGFKAFLVGGNVRDMLLNIPNTDIDICTDAKPCEIKGVFWAF